MEDVIISYETAVLTKQKGYPQESTKLSLSYYNHKGELNGDVRDYIKARFAFKDGKITQEELDKFDTTRAMSQSLLQKWLREEHKLIIVTQTHTVKYYSFNIYSLTSIVNILYLDGRNINDKKSHYKHYNTYEEALEVALQKALKLIK